VISEVMNSEWEQAKEPNLSKKKKKKDTQLELYTAQYGVTDIARICDYKQKGCYLLCNITWPVSNRSLGTAL
jgi:hypothetical protein